MRVKSILFIFLITFVILTSLVLADDKSSDFVLSVIPQHKEGFFVEFTSIGISFGNIEISTQPLFNVLGIFNLRFRYYISPLFVSSLETYFFDPFFISKTYMGEPYDESKQFYIVFNRSYVHMNMILKPVIIKPYAELLTILVGNYKFSEYAGSTILRGFLSIGTLLSKNTELFGTFESGIALTVWTSSTVSQEEWNTFLNELRQKTFYITFRTGLDWYYDNYSGLEIGYRIILYGNDSPLRLVQGFTITDWIYNMVSSINTSSEQKVNIPFITTDYYLSFSVKF